MRYTGTLIAIDPGPERSAVVIMHGDQLRGFGIYANPEVLALISGIAHHALVIEKIASYGMPVGEEVFATCRWSGRFEQRAIDGVRPGIITYLPRLAVKMAICKSPKANDATIRQALIDRYGGAGSIKKGGPLYKVSKDVWAALALAETWLDQQAEAAVISI